MFENPLHTFSKNLFSLRDFVDLVDTFLSEQERKVLKDHHEDLIPLMIALDSLTSEKLDLNEKELRKRIKGDLKIELTENEAGDKEVKLVVSGEAKESFDKAMSVLGKSRKRISLLYFSSLMNLISTIEWFFSQILHLYYEKYPDAIGSKDKAFSLEELKSFDTIADARKYYIDAKIEEILYGSFSDWIEFFRKKVGLSMGYLEPSFDILVETFQRRNLVVHNGGIINSQYLSKVSKDLTKGLKIGLPVGVDRKYLDERIDLFECSCLLIAFELWKKIDKTDKNRADLIVEFAYQHLLEKRWSIMEALSLFLMNDNKMPEVSQLLGKMNYWLSIKRQGRWDEIKEGVEKTDFSAKDNIFKLALASLKEDSDFFFSLLPKVLQSGELEYKYLIEFPIFEEMRSDERYNVYCQEYEPGLDTLNEKNKEVLRQEINRDDQTTSDPGEILND